MPWSKSSNSLYFTALCENCKQESGPLSNNIQIAAYRLMDYGWIVYDNYETTFCSEACLDEYEIDHIEKVIENER